MRAEQSCPRQDPEGDQVNAPQDRRGVLIATESLLEGMGDHDEQTILRVSAGPLRQALLSANETASSNLVSGRPGGFGAPLHALVDGDMAVALFQFWDIAMYATLIRSDNPYRSQWLVVELGERHTGAGPAGPALTHVGGPFAPIDRPILEENLHALAERIRNADPHRALYSSIDWNDRRMVVSQDSDGNVLTVGDVLDELDGYTTEQIDQIARTDETWLFVFLREQDPLLWLRP